MTVDDLAQVARALVAEGKGLLAIDESIGTCNRRFAARGIPQTVEMRRAWRELLVTTPDLAQSISGVILYDETMSQQTGAGASFLSVLADAGILAGIKVDIGTTDLAGHPGEKVTEGLDGLGNRLDAYADRGARFAKWRAVFAIGDGVPSRACVEANAMALARYAALCQRAGLVPMVEPEVLMSGRHGLPRCAEVTEAVLHAVFRHLYEQGVALEAMILKPNMVLAGEDCPDQPEHRRGGGSHPVRAAAYSPRRGSGHRLPLRRPVRRVGHGAPERDGRQVSRQDALAADLLVRPRHPGTRARPLARA